MKRKQLFLSLFQNSVSFGTGFAKKRLQDAFSVKSKVAVPKTEVLEQPLLYGFLLSALNEIREEPHPLLKKMLRILQVLHLACICATESYGITHNSVQHNKRLGLFCRAENHGGRCHAQKLTFWPKNRYFCRFLSFFYIFGMELAGNYLIRLFHCLGEGKKAMRIKTKTIIPLVSLTLGLFWVFYGLANYEVWHELRGPVTGFVPIMMGVALAAMSIVGAIQARKGEEEPDRLENWSIMLAALITFSLVFIVGMLIAILSFVFVWLKVYEKARWKDTLIVLAIVFGIIFGAFGQWLQIPFPNGIIINAILS